MIAMAEHMSLLEFLQELMSNRQARDWFANEPDAALTHYGLENLSPTDVHDAVVLSQDTQTADFDREYNTGHNATFAPPPPVASHHAGGDHEAAVDYLNQYITNASVNDQHTIADHPANHQVDRYHGGDFDQDIDVHTVDASGDGAVAAGHDITNSTIVPGDDNQIGAGNLHGNDNVVGTGDHVISGDGNTTAFGNGAATSASFDNATVSRGGAISVGGGAAGSYDVNGSFNHTDTSTATTTDFHDSFNVDHDTATNSFNDTSADLHADSHDHTENHLGSHNDVVVDH
jgi:hypothetical protein